MARKYKDRVTDGTAGQTVYRMVDDTTGQTYVARARLEAVNVVEAGDQFGAAAANRLLELDTDGTPLLKVDGGTVGDKPGVIQLLRQGENDVLPGNCAYGEPVVAKDGTIYVGDEGGKPVQQATKADAVALQQALDVHKSDLKNPHKVTREQLDVPSTNDLKSHVENEGNPHKVTAKQAGALAVDGKAADSAKLNGQAAGYYAKATELSAVKKTADGALPKTSQAVDSAKLNGQAAGYYATATALNAVKATADGALPKGSKAADSAKLNGQAASYYATATALSAVKTKADGALQQNGGHMRGALDWTSDTGVTSVFLGHDHNAWLDFRASGKGYLFRNADGNTDGIELNTGTVNAHNIPGSSSRRYKEAVESVPAEALEKLLAQEVVSFRYKEGCRFADGGKRHMGMIAEEMEKALPEIVYYDGEKRVEGINYAALVPHLLRLAQLEHEKSKVQDERLEMADQRIKDLKKKIKKLEKWVEKAGKRKN